jgi:hypothetical protein
VYFLQCGGPVLAGLLSASGEISLSSCCTASFAHVPRARTPWTPLVGLDNQKLVLGHPKESTSFDHLLGTDNLMQMHINKSSVYSLFLK